MPRTEEEKKAWGAKMKLAREAKKLKSESGQVVEVEAVKPKYVHLSEVGEWPEGKLPEVPENGKQVFSGQWSAPQLGKKFDWEESPLEECQQKAAEMKREYERVSVIVIRRQNPNNRFKWKCWTQENMSEVPPGLKYNGQSVRSSCLRGGDGITQLPKFTDNGNFEIVEGVRTLKPVHCCNFLCYQLYQSKRVRQKVEAGV